jgi:hypothetical protein
VVVVVVVLGLDANVSQWLPSVLSHRPPVSHEHGLTCEG